jgi:hypothetical protein
MRSRSLLSIVAEGAVHYLLDARAKPPDAAPLLPTPTPLYRVRQRAGLPSLGGSGWG